MGGRAQQPSLHILALSSGTVPTSRSDSEPALASPRPTGSVGSLGGSFTGWGESCLPGGSGWDSQPCSPAAVWPSSACLPQPEPPGAPAHCLSSQGPAAR